VCAAVPIKLLFLVKSAKEAIRPTRHDETVAVFQYLDLCFEDIATFFRQQCGCDTAEVQSDCIKCYFSSTSSFQKFCSQYKTRSLQLEFSTKLQKMEIEEYVGLSNQQIVTYLEVEETYFEEGEKHFSSAEFVP